MRSQLTQNNNNLPLPFLGGNYPILSLSIFINIRIVILTGSPGHYFLIIVYVI